MNMKKLIGDHSAHVSTYLTVGEILQYDMRRRPQVGSKEEEALYIAGQFSLIQRHGVVR